MNPHLFHNHTKVYHNQDPFPQKLVESNNQFTLAIQFFFFKNDENKKLNLFFL